jgi:hypothetical protein
MDIYMIMKKVIKLTESNLIKLVKKLTNEAMAPEPVFTPKSDFFVGGLFFKEGETSFNTSITNQIINDVANKVKSSIPTIQKFHKDSKFKLPQFIKLYVGTSSTGSFDRNKKIAQSRMNYLTDICVKAFQKYGIRADVAYKLVVQSYDEYTPSKIDRDFYDPSKVNPNSAERTAYIVIEPITTKGLGNDNIGDVSGSLIDSSSYVNTVFFDLVDEEGILNAIKRLQTYSDITDLNKTMINARRGDLQSFLNSQLSDDPEERRMVANHLNSIAKRSGKGSIANIVRDNISIIIENKKVIKLTESDLKKIIEKVISEQTFGYEYPPIEQQMKKVKPDAGGKYCFSPQMAQRLKRESGLAHLVYKVKQGDVLSKLIQKNGGLANSIHSIEYGNDLCPEIKKGIIKTGNVIVFNSSPDTSTNM